MKGGGENRRKTILAGGLGALALCCVIYGYNALFGGSSPAPTPVATPAAAAPVANAVAGRTANTNATAGSGGRVNGQVVGPSVAPGVAAVKMASTSSSLDPTLDQTAMLRTESLVYSGTGRNIFSATYTAVVAIPDHVPPARPRTTVISDPPRPPGPPPLPPINLKFFGTFARLNGGRQAFLLQGEDVYLASQGDIVARKYRIVAIGANSIQVEDLTNKNTQTLPLQVN